MALDQMSSEVFIPLSSKSGKTWPGLPGLANSLAKFKGNISVPLHFFPIV